MRMSLLRFLAPCFVAAVLTVLPLGLAGQLTRTEVRVPMRDGVELATDLWLPEGDGPFPTVLVRTPYGKSEALFFRYALNAVVADGYAVALQDTRGTGASGGTFDFYFPEAEDGYDSIEWLADQSWSNGAVATDGGSYLGTVQWLAAGLNPPSLRCIMPTAPSGDLFNELPYVGGAFHFGWALQWFRNQYSSEPEPAPERWAEVARHRPLLNMDELVGGPFPAYRKMLEHPTLDDFWEPLHVTPLEMERIGVPALTVTGWFDGDQAGALYYWSTMHAGGRRPEDRYLVIGPWVHAGTYLGGTTEQGRFRLAPEAMLDVGRVRHQFLDWCLKGDREGPGIPRALVYVTGSDRWLHLSDYPPPSMTPTAWYLGSRGSANTSGGDGTLGTDPPADEPADTFSFDPMDPVPTSPAGADRSVMEERRDVLVYTSRRLSAPMDVVGPVEVVLHASSDARDTDFTAKLIDVFPDGTPVAVNHAGGVLRTRYRAGFDKTSPITPGEVYELRIRLYDVGRTFLPGHRIRLEVSSSDFPYVNPNQNTGNPVATDTEWVVAHQTVFHDRQRPSHVLLPILQARQ